MCVSTSVCQHRIVNMNVCVLRSPHPRHGALLTHKADVPARTTGTFQNVRPARLQAPTTASLGSTM